MKMKTTLIKNAKIVNDGTIFNGDILIEGEYIKEVAESISLKSSDILVIDAEGKYLLPGAIDDQVHFREPGLTHKANIETESKAAIAGGITSFIEMPNTTPQTTTVEKLEEKFEMAAQTSSANYSFMFGGTNDNPLSVSLVPWRIVLDRRRLPFFMEGNAYREVRLRTVQGG